MAEEPHAVSATYDAAREELSLRFAPDALLIIEHIRKALPELSELTNSELAKVEVVGCGETLMWSEADVAIGVGRRKSTGNKTHTRKPATAKKRGASKRYTAAGRRK